MFKLLERLIHEIRELSHVTQDSIEQDKTLQVSIENLIIALNQSKDLGSVTWNVGTPIGE
jgi:inhibitor of KinA sporulation pathway (predicted exonuclease)